MYRNSYLYVLPDHPMKRSESDFKYLSIKKMNRYFNFQVGDKIFLVYRKSKKNVPGIIGSCHVAGKPMRVRDINKDERHLCTNLSFWQLPVKWLQCGTRNIISEDLLYSLPTLNEYGRLRAFTEYTMIKAYNLDNILKKRSKYWYIWRARRTEKEVEQYNELFTHEIREYYAMDHKKYHQLSEGINQCSYCGIYHDEYLPYTPPFFEFHETIKAINPKGYRKIDLKNFVALCPNCHKKAHEKIVEESFRNKDYGYYGFDTGGLFTGWNPDAFKDEID